MTQNTGRKRPVSVTFAVVLMYIGGIGQIALGILTIFLRYVPGATTGGIAVIVTLLGAAMILFGLFVIALASAVARGSRASRVSATAVMLLGLVVAIADLVVGADGDWSGVVVQSVASIAVVIPLWVGAGQRYFATL